MLESELKIAFTKTIHCSQFSVSKKFTGFACCAWKISGPSP